MKDFTKNQLRYLIAAYEMDEEFIGQCELDVVEVFELIQKLVILLSVRNFKFDFVEPAE